MTNLTKWATTLTIKRFIKKIDTEFALLTLSCFKSFLFMSRYYCQSHCWNNAQTPSMLFFWAGCANFLPENAKTLLFCILLWKLAYFMGEYVSLKGGIAHFILMFHALLPQILKYCFCGIFSYVLSVCAIFFAFFGLWSIRQKKETLPKAKRPESWVQLKKVTWLSHITSSNTNLNQILESLLSTISTKHQHLAET